MQITSTRLYTGHILTINECKNLLTHLLSYINKIGFYSNAMVRSVQREPVISFREFKLTNAAIKDRGGMNVSPWQEGIRRRHIGFEDWILLIEFINHFLDKCEIACDVDARIGNKTTRVRNLTYGSRDISKIRKEFINKTTSYYDKKLGKYTKKTTFENLWKPENYTRALKWIKKTRKKIKKIITENIFVLMQLQ